MDVDVLGEGLPPGVQRHGNARFTAEVLGLRAKVSSVAAAARNKSVYSARGLTRISGLRACGRVKTTWK